LNPRSAVGYSGRVSEIALNPFDAPHRPQAASERQFCDSCGSRVAGLCRPLDAAALDEISAESDKLSLPARAYVFREGDPAGRIYTLIEGMAKLTRLLPDGKQQVVGFRFPGDVIGYTTRPDYPFDAELLTDARMCRLDRKRLDGLLRRYPLLERRMLDLCVQELAATQEQLVTVGRRSAEARVAAFLLSLVDACHRRGQSETLLEMPMTRADIADFLGLTLETVSRSLTAFRKRGWIREPAHQRMELLNLEALSALAEGSIDGT
jgi:CRP/FNR family transcriptional regulator, anaerobic regulatory protein